MDKETASYILNYFNFLLTQEEKTALRHSHSLIKLDGEDQNSVRRNMYKRKGWLTEDKEILALLEEGYDTFELNVAQRILSSHPDKVFLNYCPTCSRLARTPQAKQCRHCGHNWHE